MRKIRALQKTRTTANQHIRNGSVLAHTPKAVTEKLKSNDIDETWTEPGVQVTPELAQWPHFILGSFLQNGLSFNAVCNSQILQQGKSPKHWL